MTWHGILFQSAHHFWENLRRFAFYNRTIFEVFFVFLYAFEQFLLIWLTFQSHSITELSYIVSIFAIIVLTTFSLHKILMESRIKYLEEEIHNLHQEKLELEIRMKSFQKVSNNLIDALSKDLNTYTSSNNNHDKKRLVK